jgi:putative endonuclease
LAAYSYIIECSDGTLYTGWTVDLTKRLDAHNNGTGAKYTRGRGPVKLVYYETYANKQMAQEREYALKQLTRKEKVALIETFVERIL